jgi:hypothetical protein
MKISSDFDHEIMNLVEKNVGTPAILGRTVFCYPPCSAGLLRQTGRAAVLQNSG